MNEGPPKPAGENETERSGNEAEALGRWLDVLHLIESQEVLPFPGLKPESYAKLKADEEKYPGFVTPIDDLLERMKNEGMKVVLGKHPESKNIFILPAGSRDVENDSVLPKDLDTAGLHSALRGFIEAK